LEEDVKRIREMEKNHDLFTFQNESGLMVSPSVSALMPHSTTTVESGRSDW
jgi:hypothetical protein